VRRIVFLLLAVLAVLALAGCGGSGGDDDAAAPAAAPAGDVQELANVLDLRAAFEADTGKPRVLFLFSPT
jgi:ABC-type glycerol-3-phosphate transport system substrate-binding protein